MTAFGDHAPPDSAGERRHRDARPLPVARAPRRSAGPRGRVGASTRNSRRLRLRLDRSLLMSLRDPTSWSPSPICRDKPASRLPARTSRSRSSTASPTSCLRMTRRSMPLSRLWFSAQCPIRRARWSSYFACCAPAASCVSTSTSGLTARRSRSPSGLWTGCSGRARSGGVTPLATPPARSPSRASRSSSCGGCGSTRCRSLGRMRSAARADAEAAASTGWKARQLGGGFHG